MAIEKDIRKLELSDEEMDTIQGLFDQIMTYCASRDIFLVAVGQCVHAFHDMGKGIQVLDIADPDGIDPQRFQMVDDRAIGLVADPEYDSIRVGALD